MRHLVGFVTCTVLSTLAVGGCDTTRSASTPPDRPATNDPVITAPTQLYALVGDVLTPATTELRFTVEGPTPGHVIEVWLDDVRITTTTVGAEITLDTTALAAGEHELLLAYPGEATARAAVPVSKGAALYVIMTTDWDDPDNADSTLRLQEQLHDNHAALKITHFVGPYTFTDPELPEARKTLLADWVKGMRDTYDDEIGTHIHPWCHFVVDAGVECQTKPSSVYTAGDESGYTVMLGAYDRETMATLLAHVDTLFAANGLGKPTSFRAGGWTAEVATLQALADTGYIADTSALNWARMEEWQGARPLGQAEDAILYAWNMLQWGPIDDTSQPYQPTETSILGDDGGTPIPILEVPDNGIMVDYVTGEEMIAIFAANWPGGALAAPTQLTIGYHPPNFDQTYFDRLELALDHYDQFLAAEGRGPVVYTTLSRAAALWPLATP